MNYESKTVIELRAILKKKRLKTVGRKEELISRLKEFDTKEFLINVKVMSGKLYQIKIKPSYNILHIKMLLYEQTTYNPQTQLLYLKTNVRKTPKDMVWGENSFIVLLKDQEVVETIGLREKDELLLHCTFCET